MTQSITKRAIDTLREFIELSDFYEEADTIGSGLYVARQKADEIIQEWNEARLASLSGPKKISSYEVSIRFVDSSYWDDGSRYTNRTFRFDSRKKTFEFVESLRESGVQVKGVGGPLFVAPHEMEITVIRNTRSEVICKTMIAQIPDPAAAKEKS